MMRLLESSLRWGVLALALPFAGQAGCLENNDVHRRMPREIGDALLPSPDGYAFTCDTILVREGDTARVHAANRLYFGKTPTPQSIIWVKGVLLLEGTAKNPIILAGNVRSSSTEMLAPTDEEWGGIRVAKSGKLVMKHVHFHGAAIPIATLSDQVSFESVRFENGISILGPEGYQMKLAARGAYLEKAHMRDLLASSKQPATALGPKPVASPRKNGETVRAGSESRLKYWVWGGVGLGILAGGATVAALYWPDGSKEPNPESASSPRYPEMSEKPPYRP